MSNNYNELKEVLQPVLNYDKRGKADFYDKHIAIDTVGFMQYLARRGKVVGFADFYGDDPEEQLEELIMEDSGAAVELKGDNTCNYNEPYTHAMAAYVPVKPDECEPYYVAFCAHISGDVRCNYCEKFVLYRFTSFWDYLDAAQDYYEECEYSFELDGENYTMSYSGGEYFYLSRNGECLTDGFVPEPWTEEDFIKSVRAELGA